MAMETRNAALERVIKERNKAQGLVGRAQKAIYDRWPDECPWCETSGDWFEGVHCRECGQVPWMQEIQTLQARLSRIVQDAYGIISEATAERRPP